MRKSVVAGVIGWGVLALWMSAAAQTTPLITTDQLAGRYHVDGMSDKGPYVGDATIMQRDRAVFVQWVLQSGETYAGFGLVTGQSVAVGYASGPVGGQVGVAVVYAITAERLVGEWPDGSGAMHAETLTRKAPGDPDVVPRGRVVPRVQAQR